MGTQPDFVENLRAATERLWVHRKMLRTVAVRIGFWPVHPTDSAASGGLVISARPSIDKHGNDGLKAWTQEVVPWAALATMGRDDLIATVDRVCQPSHDLIGRKGPGS
jgi:hypothetical protein